MTEKECERTFYGYGNILNLISGIDTRVTVVYQSYLMLACES